MRRRQRIDRSSVRSAPPRALSLGFAVAFGLHALGLALLALVRHALPTPPAVVALTPRPPEEALTWFDRLDEPSPPAEARAGDGTNEAASEAGGATPEPPRRSAERGARLALVPRPSPAPSAATPPAEPAASDGSGAEDEDPAATGNGEAPNAGAEASGNGAGSKPLSLDQLGVGPAHNPFLAPSGNRSSTAALGRRVDHVLRSALAEHDQQIGLGPEGPVIAAVTDLVMQSTTAPNSDALLLVRTDATGQVVHVEVTEAGRDADAWNAVAQSLLKSLQGKKLRVASGTGGATLQVRVVSRNALPSGADPGLAIDLFGQEVKAGEGKRSTRLQLLTPKIVLEQYHVSSTDPHVTIPVVGFSMTLFNLAGDPVDIAAVARRVVHAHLVSLETHPRDPDQ